MTKTEIYHLHPLGWETDPDEERLRFSSIDYIAPCTYQSYALFFKLGDEERAQSVAVLKKGLERTLAQCRQLVGIIEKNDDNDDHSFVKKRDSTVKFVVKHFGTEDGIPSMSDIEKSHFASASLDVDRFVVEGMAYGERPECLPSAKPVISAFQANYIPGGLIFVVSSHHYANDVMGWANFVFQLAENCSSIVSESIPPSWDPANLDASRFTASDFPSKSKVDGPTPPERNPLLREHSCLLLHLPLSKAAELKRLATPTEKAATVGWISTYDAFSAALWRVLTRHRAPLYQSGPEVAPLLFEAVNMRRRADPPVAKRLQRNLFWAASSTTHADPLIVKQVAASEDEVPLSRLAAKIRTMTNGMNQAAFDQVLTMLAPIRDKTCLFTRLNSFPPLTMGVTDWREAAVCQTADFGFAQPCAWRHFFDAVTEGLILIYPPRKSDNPDEGCEFAVTVETDIIDAVLGDRDLMDYFEFRG